MAFGGSLRYGETSNYFLGQSAHTIYRIAPLLGIGSSTHLGAVVIALVPLVFTLSFVKS